MNFLKYCKKHPLTRFKYEREDVQKIRQHAFNAGREPGKKLTRSQQQNKYYWGVVCKILSDETGYDPEEIHQILGQRFLAYERKGEVFTKSTTKLKVSEFEDYMERCRRFASMELNCFIPLPNEAGDFSYDVPKTKSMAQ